MNSHTKNITNKFNVALLRIISGYSICLFLVLMLLGGLVVIPHINKLIEEQYDKIAKVELANEVVLLKRFIENKRSVLKDLAQFPSVVSAVILSDSKNQLANKSLENALIDGSKGRLVLQDIRANILVKTSDELEANYSEDEQWAQLLLTGFKPYDFQLLNQKDDFLLFKMSVPVIDNGYVVGLLSGEIKVDFNDVFVNERLNQKISITLSQNNKTVGSHSNHIKIARVNEFMLEEVDVLLTYITDDSPLLKRKRSVQNLIYVVLLGSLSVSFILFFIFSYSGLFQSKKIKYSKNKVLIIYAMPILVGFIGVCATITAFTMVLNTHKVLEEKNQINESQKHIQAMREKINTHLNALDAIKSFYEAAHSINRNEFKTIVSSFVEKYNNALSFQWVPYIPHNKREHYQELARSEGLYNYSINELQDDGKLVLARERDYYFPVYYIEPLQANIKALGFDNASNPNRLIALHKAKETGHKFVSSKIKLVQAEKEQAGILIFNPVFRTLNEKENFKKQNLQGFIVLELKVDALINSIFKKKNNNLLVVIEDIYNPAVPEILYGNIPKELTFSRNETINLAGRDWRITTYNKNAGSQILSSAWGTLLSGLVFTGLIVLGLINLIHRRAQIEELVIVRTAELSASEEQHRAVVESAVDGLITIDEFGNIERFNRAAENIFGYSAEEVIGINVKILMSFSDKEKHDEYLKGYLYTNEAKIIGLSRYLQGQHKDGTLFPIELSVSQIKLGTTKKFSGIVRDIRERVALEKEREQFIEQLTNSNEELERFAYVCSHDLQEPLRMIKNFSEQLQEHLKDELDNDEKAKKYFNFVHDGAIRAQALIVDILSYSSISNDTSKLENINIETLINTIKSTIINASQGDEPQITFKALPNLQGNKTQLYQLFQNLINNGLKYQLIDSAPHVHISVKSSDSHWIFKVQDNGIGIDERHFTKIFDVFQRLHRRSKFAGTGVGLSICKKVVERHGGTIWVESEKGKGSTFFFTLLKSNL